MIILPSMDETIQSNRKPDEICEALREVTVSRKEHHYGDGRGEFIGEVGTAGFKVVSNIRYRNSFLPIITGSIRTEGSKTIVTIKMRMHLLVSVFLAVWLGFVDLFFLAGILVMVIDINDFSLLFAAGVMMLIGRLLIRGGFYVPAKKAMERMKEFM